MTYDEVVSAFFQPSPEGVVPPPVTDASPARRLRDAIEPIAMHSVWSRHTHERLAGLGLDFFSAYVWGRASLLGEPDPGVVVSSFAVFDAELLTSVYAHARATCSREEVVAAREEATIESLRAVLGDADVAGVADRLGAAVRSADPTGRPLFAGLARQPWPADPIGRLWRACELAREHRGDSHVAASVAAGLDPITMNVLTEVWVGMPLGSYSATRGWTPEQIAAASDGMRAKGWLDGDVLSPAGRAWRDDLEAATDALEQSIVDALGADLDADVAALDEWSARCVAACGVPARRVQARRRVAGRRRSVHTSTDVPCRAASGRQRQLLTVPLSI